MSNSQKEAIITLIDKKRKGQDVFGKIGDQSR